MAYNRENLLKRIIEVQNIVLEHKKYDTPQTRIYEKYVRKQYHISYSRFCDWLGVPAKLQLKELLEKKAQQKKVEDMQQKLF